MKELGSESRQPGAPGNSMAIGLFLMTEKGLKVLEAIVGRFGSEHIAWVVGARDRGLVDDCFDDIASLCRENQIEFYCKGEETKHEHRTPHRPTRLSSPEISGVCSAANSFD
jgi:hypothetical protein